MQPACRAQAHRAEQDSGLPIATWLKPPSTYTISALTPPARSDSRKAATLPTSSVVMVRRIGVVAANSVSSLPKSLMPEAASVLIGPAEMPLTRMPLPPRLCAKKRTLASSEALARPIVL